jgi:uncharacterized protein (DUF697 family)
MTNQASSTNAAAPSPASAPASAQAAAIDPAARLEKGRECIRHNVFWALGAGVVPIPILDIAAVMAVEMKMLRELSSLYGVNFSEGLGKKIAYSLLSSIGMVGIGGIIGGSLSKLIPVFGQTLGLVSVPILVAAFTHSLGQVLVMHFEAGGTLLDFDPAAMRAHFKAEFEKAKQTVSQMKSEVSPASPRPA